MDIVILILMSALHTAPTLAISTHHHVRAVSPHDYYRNAPLPPHKTNWEVGLKEATYQALLREHVSDPRLKEAIYAASVEGYQDAATPFGDIAVIARGQLYALPHGYHFVQDPYQNDCDDCHTPHRCARRQCEPAAGQPFDSLLALWTVKRVRHRDTKFGHRYELQFTISPRAQQAAHNSRHDYSVPGHVFIVKLQGEGSESGAESVRSPFKFDKEHRGLRSDAWVARPTDTHPHTPNSVALNTGEYYSAGGKERPSAADFLVGYKHMLPATASPYSAGKRFVASPELTTNAAVKHYHHHFYIPEVEDIEYEHKVVTASTRDIHPFAAGFRPTVPHKFLVTTGTPKRLYTPESTQAVPPLATFGSAFEYPASTVPLALAPTIFTEPSTLKVFTMAGTQPTQPTPFSASPFYVQYSDPDPGYRNNQPPTVATFVAPAQPTGTTFYTIPGEPTLADLFGEMASTQATTAATVVVAAPAKPYHDSINSQLPPPEQGSDTTVPYVPSTAVTILADSDEHDAESSDRQSTTVHEAAHQTTTTVAGATEEPATKATIALTTSVERTQGTVSAVPEETSTLAAASTSTTTTPATTPERRVASTSTTTTTPERRVASTSTTTTTPERRVAHEDGLSTPKKTKAKVDEFDIFGGVGKKPQIGTTVRPRAPSAVGKKPSAFDEIFGASTTERTKLLTPHTSLTVSPESALRNARISKYLKYKRNKSERLGKFRTDGESAAAKLDANGTDDRAGIETKTSQSLITSISFKVNRSKSTGGQGTTPVSTTLPDGTDTVTEAVVQEMPKNDTHMRIHQVTTTTDRSQTFDDVAQTLVNHARAASLLHPATARPTKRTYTPALR